MEKKIQGIHLELTEGLKSKIESEVGKIQELFINDVSSDKISIDISVDKIDHVCHIKFVRKNKVLNVTKKSHDMYTSIDESFDTLRKLITKNNHKVISLTRQKQSVRNVNVNNLEKEENDILEVDDQY